MSVILTPSSQGHRIDHQGYAPEVWIGLFLTSLFLLQTDPTMVAINDDLEFALDLLLALGTGVCILASALGTRWFFPRFPKRWSYRMHQAGLSVLVVVLAWYTYASSNSPNLVLVALGGGLGLVIEIATVRMFIEITAALGADDVA